ncbi:LysR family transcriptional regulator [Parapusillimonas granuli]|uniref:LysR family transcriptional regulator n=1 Tax=Parapusillimonas granuli TaxID=380911 RepID=A0A853G9F3_9BURK|nr:LysR family transcriptional regulator [Parapusillimonas granuli]MBB5214252.1 DNA-binding transcriptional LysR family regulator [Parapusillimonas granuli]MEB2399079.1 LysR family transcriptional regulator [Alcaligenaceae bacterium]NYT51356.1 LysR family transcriptional regulator [Parapusillimonas granuli]
MAIYFDLTDMHLMVNVAAARSMTKGAEQSFLSLPAASNRVKNLESRLGTALLYRNSQGVTLTPSGEAFVRHARIVLRQLEHLRGDIQEYASGIKGRVRIYANTTAMNEFMPDILARYLAEHRDVNVELRERLSPQVVKAVADGTADIGITAKTDGGENVEFLPYRNDRLVLVTHADHPLAAHESVDFTETLAYDYVSLSESSAIHAFLLQAADELGRALRFRVEVGNFEAVCRMIAANVGIGVIPATAARRYVRDLPLRRVALNDAWALRRLHICVKQFDRLPVFAKELVSVLLKDEAEGVTND